MRVTEVSPIYSSRNNQRLNRDDSEDTANRKPPKVKKGGDKKVSFKEELSKRLNPSDNLSISSFAQEAANRRNTEMVENLDEWSGL